MDGKIGFFKTDFLINAQEINYNLNTVDTVLRSCCVWFHLMYEGKK